MDIIKMQSGSVRPLANMLPRNLFNAEHEAFRETVRKFYEKEVVPNIAKYEEQQQCIQNCRKCHRGQRSRRNN